MLEQGRRNCLPTRRCFHFGQTYAKLKENDKAREALNRCLELASVYVPAKALLEALE
ncbi:MAG: tetratricopeptide repeat protein [Vampirovibrionales bacterium]